MRFDGLGADPEVEGDLLVEVAARDEPQHLLLARGELVEVGGLRRRGGRAAERVQDEAGEPR